MFDWSMTVFSAFVLTYFRRPPYICFVQSDNQSVDNHLITMTSMESFVSWTCLLFLTVYCGLVIYAISKALQVGSQTNIISVIHRWSGIMTLVLPVVLIAYEAIYEIHPNVYVYLFTLVTIAGTCIFGGLLIPKRTPKWDLPTIRIFVSAVMGGLSLCCLSLTFRFGHLSSFDLFDRFVGILVVLYMVYAIADCVHHLQQFVANMKNGTAMDLGYRSRSMQWKKPSDVGLKYEAPSLWYCFVTAFWEKQNAKDRDNVAMATVSPSSLPVVLVQIMTALNGVLQCLPSQHLIRGHQGMIHVQDAFPKATQMSVYGYLAMAVAYLLGTFALTLVELLSNFMKKWVLFCVCACLSGIRWSRGK